VVKVMTVPEATATLSSNAIAEAALREQHLVKEVDPLCGTSVEIRPLQVAMPRGNRTADYYRARGYHYRIQGNFDAAIREYRNALKMGPRDFKALFNLGLVYDRMGETKHALACYRRACKVDPLNGYLHFNMGICYLHEEEFDLAITCFSHAIDVEGGNALFFKNRAFAYRKAGRYADAAKDYTAMGRCEADGDTTTVGGGGGGGGDHGIDLPRDADDDDDNTHETEMPRLCPVYNGKKGTQNEQGLFYYDAQPLYTPRDSSIRAATTMERKDPRVCYKIAAAPPDTRSDGDIQFLMDKSRHFPVCRTMPDAVHRHFCTHVAGVRVSATTVLFQEDDGGAFTFLLLVGRVNIIKHSLIQPDTSDATRPTVESWLRRFPPDQLHKEATLLDEDFLRQHVLEPTELPLYTLRPGAEFGNHGRFRQFARSCTAVVEEDSQLLVVPWQAMGAYETEASEANCGDVMEFLSKLRLFRSVPTPQLRLIALKAKRINVSNATVIQVAGQTHDGLLIVRRGTCKLVQHTSTLLGSRRTPPGGGHAASSPGKKHQHQALHHYTSLEHEDDPLLFLHVNQTLTRQLMAVPPTLRPEVVKSRLIARDFVGEASFLSNDTNQRANAAHTLVADSDCDLLFLRKADFFADTSYYTRQRVRSNIQHVAATKAIVDVDHYGSPGS
ncbi:hypothetical protein As57867_016283, partial [Aphanomyces stellatus]